MSKKIVVIIMLCFSLLVSCNDDIDKSKVLEIEKNVVVLNVSPKTVFNYEKYIGSISANNLQQLSFEVSGRVINIEVKIGDKIVAGDLLASVDIETLQFALEAANAEYLAAKSQYSKAISSEKYAKLLFERTEKLFNEGSVAQNEFDKVKLNYNISIQEVTGALNLKNQSLVNVKAKTYMLDRSNLYATKNGIIIDVLNVEGETIGAGYPIVIIRNKYPIMSFGAVYDDLKYITIGEELNVEIDKVFYEGVVDFISQVPDVTTQTYEVKILLKNSDIRIGSLASVKINTEEVNGVEIPMSSIRTDNDDYIFIAVDGVAKKVNIEIVELINQMVIIKGIDSEAKVIVEGIKGLENGSKIKVIKE